MPSKMGVGIVIVNWRSKGVILECLESIKKAGYLKSVVVVDNGSEDGSVEKIKNQKSKIKIIENKENLGFAQGNNVGIRFLLGIDSSTGVSLRHRRIPKYILILNPDTQINKNTIPNLLKTMDEDKKIGIAGPKILFPSPPGRDFRIWSCGGVIDKNRFSAGLIGLGEVDRGQYDKIKEVDFISGTAMMVRREVFQRCGLFNPLYFIYYEDVELNLKAQRLGFKTVFVSSAEIVHRESSSIGKNSSTQEYYMARNHLLFVERNAPFLIKVRELLRLPKTLYEHWQKREKYALLGIGDYFLRRLGKRNLF